MTRTGYSEYIYIYIHIQTYIHEFHRVRMIVHKPFQSWQDSSDEAPPPLQHGDSYPSTESFTSPAGSNTYKRVLSQNDLSDSTFAPVKKLRSSTESDQAEKQSDDMNTSDDNNSIDQDADCNTMASNEKFACLVLTDREWSCVCQDSASVLRHYSTKFLTVMVLVRDTKGYSLVGRVKIGHCVEVPPMPGNRPTQAFAQQWSKLYTRNCLTAFLSNKKVWKWTFSEVDIFTERTSVWWVPSRCPNRIFQLSGHLLNPARACACPSRLSLAETAKYFMSRCTDAQQDSLVKMVDKLNGKCIRVGTTCSGSDIVVAVVKQLADCFRSEKAVLDETRMHSNCLCASMCDCVAICIYIYTIYIYICVYIYIY